MAAANKKEVANKENVKKAFDLFDLVLLLLANKDYIIKGSQWIYIAG